MNDYIFKDVTDKVFNEINLVPGYDARKTKNTEFNGRIERVIPFLLQHPELTILRKIIEEKRNNNEDYSSEINQVISEAKTRNLPWLANWGCSKFDNYYFVKAKKTENKFIEEIVIEKEKIDPKTRDFVIEVEGNHKPKLYAISVPENYFLPDKKLNRLFMHFHFRPGPWQGAGHAYQVDKSLMPVDVNLRGVLPNRDFYPYGWDYLFFNLWTYMYMLHGKPNDEFVTGLAYQAYISKKDVITIIPMTDITDLKNEEIINIDKFPEIVKGIAKFLEKEIQKTNSNFKLKREAIENLEELMNDTDALSPYRVSISCNSNGMVYMLALLQGLKKIKFVKEVYLFDPTQLEDLHNTWVKSAILWAGKEDDKYIRVYTQPFPAFNQRINVIGQQRSGVKSNTLVHYNPTLSNDKNQSLTTLALHDKRSLSEINLDLLKTQIDFDSSFIRSFESDKNDMAKKWRALHSMIPGLMYTDALSRSGFNHFLSLDTGEKTQNRNVLSSPVMASLSQPIREAYWTDSNNNKLTDYVKYGETIRLNIDMVAGLPKMFVELFSSEFDSNKRFNVLYLQTYDAVQGGQILTLDIDPIISKDIFGGTIIKGQIQDTSNNTLIKIPQITMDLVPYLPTILQTKNWQTAKKCMERWFLTPYDPKKNKKKTAVTDILTMNWAMGFTYFKAFIGNHLIDGSLRSLTSQKNIAIVVNDLVKSNKLTLPNNIGDESVLNYQINTVSSNSDGDFTPDFDMYHFQSFTLSPPYIIKPLDDFMAAVNECNINFIPIGTIRKESAQSFSIHITTVGVYILDWYDFDGDQSLGYWNVKSHDIGLLPLFQGEHAEHVTNSLFNEWRSRNRKGQNYTNFSDIMPFSFDLRFLINSNFVII